MSLMKPGCYRVVSHLTSSWGAADRVRVSETSYHSKEEAKLAIKNRKCFMMHESFDIVPEMELFKYLERFPDNADIGTGDPF